MKGSSLPLRTGRFLALLLQLVLPSLGVIADATHREDALAAQIHVESQDHECERGHPEHCAVCNFIRTPVLAAAGIQGAVAEIDQTPTATADPITTGTRERLPSLPRGPPNLS